MKWNTQIIGCKCMPSEKSTSWRKSDVVRFQRQQLQWCKLQQRCFQGIFPWQQILISHQDRDQQESPFFSIERESKNVIKGSWYSEIEWTSCICFGLIDSRSRHAVVTLWPSDFFNRARYCRGKIRSKPQHALNPNAPQNWTLNKKMLHVPL